MHGDVSVAREHVEERLTAALAAGGRIVDDADAPVRAGSLPGDLRDRTRVDRRPGLPRCAIRSRRETALYW